MTGKHVVFNSPSRRILPREVNVVLQEKLHEACRGVVITRGHHESSSGITKKQFSLKTLKKSKVIRGSGWFKVRIWLISFGIPTHMAYSQVVMPSRTLIAHMQHYSWSLILVRESRFVGLFGVLAGILKLGGFISLIPDFLPQNQYCALVLRKKKMKH